MIAQRDYRDFLADIVGACRSLSRFVEGMTLEAYLADEKTRYAVTAPTRSSAKPCGISPKNSR